MASRDSAATAKQMADQTKTKKTNGNGNYTDAPGAVTVDVLNRLVKENPANMTQALREWINKGRTTEK